MLYLVEYNLLWSAFSPTTACWALRWRFPRRSHREKKFLRLFTNTVTLTFLWRRLCKTDHKTSAFLSHFFLSVQQTVSRCMLSLLSEEQKSSWETCETEDSNTVGTPNNPVFSCVFREIRDFIEVWIVHEHRVTVHRSDLVELVGLIPCVSGPGQVAKQLVLLRRCACPALVGQGSAARWCGQKNDVEVGVQEQQRRVKLKNGESEIENKDSCDKHPFHELEPCVCVTRMRSVRSTQWARCAQKKCACNKWVYKHPSHRTHCSCYYMCTKPVKNSVERFSQEKMNIDHSTTILAKKFFNSSSGVGTLLKILRLHSISVLIFLAGTCSLSWLLINLCEWRLPGFPRHASLRDRPS